MFYSIILVGSLFHFYCVVFDNLTGVCWVLKQTLYSFFYFFIYSLRCLRSVTSELYLQRRGLFTLTFLQFSSNCFWLFLVSNFFAQICLFLLYMLRKKLNILFSFFSSSRNISPASGIKELI